MKDRTTWTNWAGNQSCAPTSIRRPTSEAELVAIDGCYRTAEGLGAELRHRPAQAWLDRDDAHLLLERQAAHAFVRGIRHKVRDGDMLLLNADDKSVIVRPAAGTEEVFERDLVDRQKKKARYAAMRDEASVTKDGVPINLMINAGLRDDMSALATTGAEGVGLFRTEFQFLISATLPQRERQQRFYRDVRIYRIYDGTNQIQQLLIARNMLRDAE